MEGPETVLLALGEEEEEGLTLWQTSWSPVRRPIFHRGDVAQAGPPKTSFSLRREPFGRACGENVALCGL